MIRFLIAKLLFIFYYNFDLLRGNDGTAYPGRFLLKICPDFLNRLLDGIDCILVTGTNGKSTTTKMIATLLEANGIKCVYNFDGSNLYFSIAGSLARQISVFNKHKIKKAVIECDESWIRKVVKDVKTEVIVVTILDVDHTLDYSSVEEVANLIKDGVEIAKDAVVCLNPTNEYHNIIRNIENRKFINYKRIGNCAYVEDEKIKINLNIKGEYNIENAAAALSAAKVLELLNEKSIKALSNMKPVYGRFETIMINDCQVTMTLIQNPIGAQVVFDEILNNKSFIEKILFIGYDNMTEHLIKNETLNYVDFNKVFNKFEKVYVLDNHKLINSFLNNRGINIDYKKMIEILENLKEPVIMTLGYDGMMKARDIFAKRKYVKQFYIK